MSDAHSVFLVGPMGSGKSAVGRALARLLRHRFVDSDAEIERRTGVDIALIFEKEGEAGFRAREREAIEALTRLPRIVLATGGGAVLLPENRACLASRGFVVYLEASVDQQYERTRHARHRPLLNAAADPRARLADLLLLREPLYRGVARLVVSTDGRRVPVVAEEIARAVAVSYGPSSGGAAPNSGPGDAPRERAAAAAEVVFDEAAMRPASGGPGPECAPRDGATRSSAAAGSQIAPGGDGARRASTGTGQARPCGGDAASRASADTPPDFEPAERARD